MKGFGRSSALRHDNDSIRTFAERHDERESRGADAAMCGETTPVRDPPYPEAFIDCVSVPDGRAMELRFPRRGQSASAAQSRRVWPGFR
jgi:hypothetical protein